MGKRLVSKNRDTPIAIPNTIEAKRPNSVLLEQSECATKRACMAERPEGGETNKGKFEEEEIKSKLEGKEIKSSFKGKEIKSSIKGKIEGKFEGKEIKSRIKGKEIKSIIKGKIVAIDPQLIGVRKKVRWAVEGRDIEGTIPPNHSKGAVPKLGNWGNQFHQKRTGQQVYIWTRVRKRTSQKMHIGT
jgi:hypothetical protein